MTLRFFFQRSALLATCLVGTALLSAPLSADDGPQYLDDRSTPQKLIQSYYNAINQQDYVRAYSYYESGSAPKDFGTWSKGFEHTKSVKVHLGTTYADPGAGQINWALPIAIEAVQKNGDSSVYAGCYDIHMANYGMQVEPPYQPMSIVSGSLKKSTESLHNAVPSSC